MNPKSKVTCAACGKKTSWGYSVTRRTPKGRRYFVCCICDAHEGLVAYAKPAEADWPREAVTARFKDAPRARCAGVDMGGDDTTAFRFIYRYGFGVWRPEFTAVISPSFT